MDGDYDYLTSGDLYVSGTEEYTDGVLVNINKKGWDNNQGYLVYIPNNCNSNTNVDFYYPWTDGYYPKGGFDSSQSAFDKYLQDGCDDIIFISKAGNKIYNNDIMNSLNALNNKYNLTSTQYNVFGHSKGASEAVNFSSYLIDSNPDIEPLNIILLDPPYNGNGLQYDINTIEKIKNKGTLFVFNNQEIDGVISSDVIKKYASEMDVALFRAGKGHTEHLAVNNEAIISGLFDFFRGKIDALDNEGVYDYMVYNDEKWIPVSLASIKKKITTSVKDNSTLYSKLSNMNELDISQIDSTLISSDLEYIYNEMNNIRNAIKNSASDSANNISFSSTTMVPNSDLLLLTNYYNITGELLSKIADETRLAANIGVLYSKLEKNLIDETELLESIGDII